MIPLSTTHSSYTIRSTESVTLSCFDGTIPGGLSVAWYRNYEMIVGINIGNTITVSGNSAGTSGGHFCCKISGASDKDIPEMDTRCTVVSVRCEYCAGVCVSVSLNNYSQIKFSACRIESCSTHQPKLVSWQNC